jgi:hypothetical protein
MAIAAETGQHLSHKAIARPSYIREDIFVVLIWSYLLVSGSLLQLAGWHYGGGGSEIEKLHPATYGVFLWIALSLAISPRFRSSVVQIVAKDWPLLSYGASVALIAIYSIVAKETSITPSVETLITPIVATVALITLTKRSLVVLRTGIDAIMIAGIAMIFVEYLLGHPLIPVYSGDTINTAEAINTLNRPAALFGHPLSAGAFLALYSMLCLMAPPGSHWTTFVRPGLAVLALGAAATTGSRSAMVVSIAMIGLFGLMGLFTGLVTNRVRRSSVFAAAILVGAVLVGVPLLASLGFFDVLLYRFDNDSGSALAREMAIQILTSIKLDDLWFGIKPQESFAIQQSYGLLAIEISWINFILVCGIVFTVPFFITYILYWFVSVPRYCVRSIYFVSLTYFILSASSNGLWTKTTGLTIGIVMSFAFLRKDLVKRF